MSDQLEYVTHGAVLECSQAAARAKFTPDYNNKVKISKIVVATAMDNKPMINIPDFVMCRKTGSKCIPMPSMWEDTYQVKVLASRTLLVKSHCKCLSADGDITFLTSGQIPLPPEAEAEFNQQRQAAGEELKKEGDSIGEPGFWTGLIPLYGSGRSLIHDVQVGHWGWAAADLGFLVWDVVDVAAFVVTLPAGGVGGEALEALETSAKAAVKGGRKVLMKATKFLTKEALEDAFKTIPHICVTACFTAGTPIHTKYGMKNIEDVRIGDEVWAWDESFQTNVLSKVVETFESNVDTILEIHTGDEIIRTTPTHLLKVNEEWRDSGDIEIGDYLTGINNKKHIVNKLVYTYEESKVYNFHVENCHTYYVTAIGILVHNKCYLRTFFNAFPNLKGLVVVHHAIEQQVLKKFPGLFTKEEIHALENLRGIPKELNNTLHLSSIRTEWNKFYDAFKSAGITPTKEQVAKYASEIDKKFGHLFNPPR